MSLMMRKVLVIGLVSIGSMFLFIEESTAECLQPDEICAHHTLGICHQTGSCEGRDCLGKNNGAEIIVVPLGPNPDQWIAKTKGYLGPVFVPNVANCLLSRSGVTFIEFSYPDRRLCVVELETRDHYFLEFFTGTENCVGWAECMCN